MPHSIKTTQDMDKLIGTIVFGTYRIEERIDYGGMTVIFRAKNIETDHDIALKILIPEALDGTIEDMPLERFHREARLSLHLNHPHLIRIFLFAKLENPQLPYLAMEYLKGTRLNKLLQGRPLPELRTIHILQQCCLGLAQIHKAGVIHRHIIPDNILLTQVENDSDFVKLIGFSIAESMSESSTYTRPGFLHTDAPEYMSPERAQAKTLDLRSDIYSLGIILFEMMTGRVPFYSDSAKQILSDHVRRPTPSPNGKNFANGLMDAQMENIIMKALSKDPADRYSNAMQMFDALQARRQAILQQ